MGVIADAAVVDIDFMKGWCWELGKVFAGSIAGKEIVNVDGTVLGELENMVIDLKTGKLVDLVVKPDPELNRMKYREDGKFVLIPFASVVAVKDYIVVDENRATKKREAEAAEEENQPS